MNYDPVTHPNMFHISQVGVTPNQWTLVSASLVQYKGTIVTLNPDLPAKEVIWYTTHNVWSNPTHGSDDEIIVEVMDPDSREWVNQVIESLNESQNLNFGANWLPTRPGDFVVADGGILSGWGLGIALTTVGLAAITLFITAFNNFVSSPEGCKALSLAIFNDCIRLRDQMYPVSDRNDPNYNPCWFEFGKCCGEKFGENMDICRKSFGGRNPRDNSEICGCAVH